MAVGSSIVNSINQISPSVMPAPQKCIDLGQGATAAHLSGDRLHLQHGPINLVIRSYGSSTSVTKSYELVIRRFPNLLCELVKDLTTLRQPVKQGVEEAYTSINDVTAKRMVSAVLPYAQGFITPMAAVAGSVADQVLEWLTSVAGVEKCYVNNGGDIAVYIADEQSLDIGVVPSLVRAVPNAKISLTKDAKVGGVATSGWDGHSYSLGVADAVTVLARTAAEADVAATMIANKVDVDHVNIRRQPASELDAACDLGERLVTVSVAKLPEALRRSALAKGVDYANELLAQGLINSALLSLQGSWQMVGDVAGVSPLSLTRSVA